MSITVIGNDCINITGPFSGTITITAGLGKIVTNGYKVDKIVNSQGMEFWVDDLRVPTGHYWQSGKIHPIMAKAKKKRKH